MLQMCVAGTLPRKGVVVVPNAVALVRVNVQRGGKTIKRVIPVRPIGESY